MTTKVKRKTRTASPAKEDELDLKAIGRRIRELRGFDTQQAEFARWAGVSQSVLSKYERGEITPSLQALAKLSKRFGKTLDWLVLGKES